MSTDGRLPTALWLEGQFRLLDAASISYYVINRGAGGSGVVTLKLNGLGAGFRLLVQQRDMDGVLGWQNALKDDNPPEDQIDAYIARAIDRDPDLWVIEIESRSLENPFV